MQNKLQDKDGQTSMRHPYFHVGLMWSYRGRCLPSASANWCHLRPFLVLQRICLSRLHEPGSCTHSRRSLFTCRLLSAGMTTAYSKPGRSVDKASAADIVEGGLFQSLGNLCFRSVYSEYLWNTSVSAPYRIIRVAAMTLISLILLVRSWRLFIRYDAWVNVYAMHALPFAISIYDSLGAHSCNQQLTSLVYRPSPDVAMVLAPISAAGWQFGMFRTIALLTLALLLTLAKQLASTPEVNSGHRAGGKGYEGVTQSIKLLLLGTCRQKAPSCVATSTPALSHTSCCSNHT